MVIHHVLNNGWRYLLLHHLIIAFCSFLQTFKIIPKVDGKGRILTGDIETDQPYATCLLVIGTTNVLLILERSITLSLDLLGLTMVPIDSIKKFLIYGLRWINSSIRQVQKSPILT